MVLAPTVAAADCPPQDVVLVYTITSLMESSKPNFSLGSTNTRSYLMAAASHGCIRLTSTQGDGTPLTVSGGVVSLSKDPLVVAIFDDTARAKKAIALVGLPA